VRADRFLFLVDREALSTAERGKERDKLRDLARRLSSGLRGRPVTIVWTKSDIKIPSTIEQDLRACFQDEFPGHAEFHIRMRFGDEERSQVEQPCLDLMKWIFASTQKPIDEFTPVLHYDFSDLFLTYRGEGARLD